MINRRRNLLVCCLIALLSCQIAPIHAIPSQQASTSPWRSLTGGRQLQQSTNSTKSGTPSATPSKKTKSDSKLDDDEYLTGANSTLSQYDFPPANQTINTTRNSTTSWLLSEQRQPKEWPLTVLGIFCMVAAVLFLATALQQRQRRLDYESIPSSMVV